MSDRAERDGPDRSGGPGGSAVVDVLGVIERDRRGRAGPRLVGHGRTFELDGLAVAVDEAVARLRAEDHAPRSIVAEVMEPDVAGVIRLLALWRAGLVPAPLNARASAHERAAAVEALASVGGSGVQVVLWTSGTTGEPRGVGLTYGNLRASIDAGAARLRLGPDDVWLASLSPAHVGGLVLIVRALMLGSTLLAEGTLGVDALSERLGAGVTHCSLVPTQLLRVLDLWGDSPAPDALRCLLLGGAHAPVPLVRRAVERGWPVALTYGMTEMTSQVATAVPEEVRADATSVGRPLGGVDVRVDKGGLILTRGPTLAAAYLTRDGTRPVGDRDGWYDTGDLGRLDGSGNLTVTGRVGDRIVTGGATVHAAEIEAALREHPAVHDVGVVGLPDPEWGEIVGAWIVPVEGEFDLDEVDGWMAERVGGSRRPRRWHVGAALPLNANGKVDRAAVRRAMVDDVGRRSGKSP